MVDLSVLALVEEGLSSWVHVADDRLCMILFMAQEGEGQLNTMVPVGGETLSTSMDPVVVEAWVM